jgi:hypothetical protein
MCEVLWRNISDFYVNLRVEMGKHPQVILAMYFFFILDKNNESPDWMTDLKHTEKLILDYYFCLKSGPVFLFQIFIIASPPPPKGSQIVSLIIN